MKVCMVTDFYDGFVGGVPSLCQALHKEFERQGHQFFTIHVKDFEYDVLPEYNDLKMAKYTWQIKEKLESIQPDLIFVMGEMNISSSAIVYCRLKNLPFLTFYQTKLPEVIEAHMKVKRFSTLKYMEWYYHNSTTVLSISDSMTQQLLNETNIRNIKPWFGGVDPEKFNPSYKNMVNKFNPEFASWPKPILLCVSRASPEKNLSAFMSLNYKGTKVFVGDGPILEDLKAKYPEVKCVGEKSGEELSAYYASADVFIFPSKSDAFGMVNIEALASGVPVVAFNATGVKDIVEEGVNGYLAYDDALEPKIDQALLLDRASVLESSRKWSISQSVYSIIENGDLVEPKLWKKINEPTIITLLSDFQIGLNLLIFNLYCYLIFLVYGMFNERGVKEGLSTVVYSWTQDLKSIIKVKNKVKSS